MSRLSHYWNGRPGGLPAGLMVMLVAAFGNLGGRVSTWFWRRNLGACGAGCRILWRPLIRHPRGIHLGQRVILAQHVHLKSETSHGRLEIGDDVWVGAGCHIDFSGHVSIGAGSTLSPDVAIYSHSHGRNPRSIPTGCRVRIGRNVWVGSGAVILQGVEEIPDDCVIGAGAMVTRSPQAGQVIVGNPGRPLGTRSGG
jgi:acetyltransferase-like isoleucine patch superfamily enzyme